MIGLLAFFTPLFLVPLISIITYGSYDHVSSGVVWISLPLLGVFLVLSPFFYNLYVRYRSRARADNYYVFLSGFAWRAFAFLVVIVSVSEMFYFGLPLHGGTVYVEFGFPLLHHIGVSSWLLLFIRFGKKWINLLMLCFALLNPILITNRDLLLLTLFALVVRQLLLDRLSYRSLLVYVCLGMAAFVIMGQLRSGYAIGVVELPVKFDFTKYGPVFFWLFVYATSSTFNFGYNYDVEGAGLFSPYINVLPEYYRWFDGFGLAGYYFFFLMIYLILFLIVKMRFKYKAPLVIFLVYQAAMASIFASKFFTTHTLFVLLIFLVFSLLVPTSYRTRAGTGETRESASS